MKISECMTAEPHIMHPDQSVQAAAGAMEQMDVGFIPVGQDDRLVGVLTDRDIVIRMVSPGLPSGSLIGEVMTKQVHFCFEHDDVSDVLNRMGALQVRRLPVLSSDKRLVGVVSLGDLSQVDKSPRTAEALSEISKDEAASHPDRHHIL